LEVVTPMNPCPPVERVTCGKPLILLAYVYTMGDTGVEGTTGLSSPGLGFQWIQLDEYKHKETKDGCHLTFRPGRNPIYLFNYSTGI
jgi:hypothetical protein